MTAKPGFVVLAGSGNGYWEVHGPLAAEYQTLRDAEAAARELSSRYPRRTFGVYELRSVFGTQERVVKQRVEAPTETPPASVARRKGSMEPDPLPDTLNVIPIRAAE